MNKKTYTLNTVLAIVMGVLAWQLCWSEPLRPG